MFSMTPAAAPEIQAAARQRRRRYWRCAWPHAATTAASSTAWVSTNRASDDAGSTATA